MICNYNEEIFSDNKYARCSNLYNEFMNDPIVKTCIKRNDGTFDYQFRFPVSGNVQFYNEYVNRFFDYNLDNLGGYEKSSSYHDDEEGFVENFKATFKVKGCDKFCISVEGINNDLACYFNNLKISEKEMTDRIIIPFMDIYKNYDYGSSPRL